MKKGVDEENPPVLYYDSRADEGSGNGESPQNQERRRMYPENYTMQNKLEETLTARCNIVVKVETPSVNETTILLQE